MDRHPSGKSGRGPSRTYTVRRGDTLWDIAQRVLRTDDDAEIARYWPRLHRENRAVIGRNPHLLIPGQVLVLPSSDR